jgi:hypothetical protein
MFSKLLQLSFTIAVVMILSACGNYIPIVPIIPTRTLPVPPTSQPVSVVTSIATQTPVLEITPTVLPIPTPTPIMDLTSKIYSLPIPGAFVNHVAMDDKYIYWTESGGNLFRYPLASSQSVDATIYTRTYFAKGILSGYPDQSLSRVGAWLIFDDRQITEQDETWALRAINVDTQTELNLAQGEGSTILLTFSSDGEWVVWITMDLSAGTIMTVQNLQTGQRQELASSDSLRNGWEEVVVSAGQAVATELGDNGRTLVLFELKSGQSRKLLSDITGSDMAGLTFDGNWIAWKTGTNYQGPTALYNLQTAKTELLPDWGITPLLVGHWLTWEAASEQPLYVVDLESHQSFIVAEAQPGDELISVAIYGNVIAWCRLHSDLPDNSKFDSTVEWRTLP